MQVTEITTLESLAQHSLKQHIDMIELLRPLQQQLETPSLNTVKQFNSIYSAFQRKIKTTDKALIQQLEMSVFTENITRLLGQRQLLQREILDILGQTVSKASSVKSLMASEMQSVKNGRVALNGYKNQSDRHGRIVNRTS